MPERPKEPAPELPRPSDQYETAIFAAELGSAPEIDLHGETVDEALVRLDQFINHEFVAGTEVVKIIHGRGSGKLRAAIHDYLRKQTELVAYFRDAQTPAQQGGATYAALHKSRK